MEATETLSKDVGTVQACHALRISRATLYRRRKRCGLQLVQGHRKPPPRALSVAERRGVLDILHCDRFMDKAPEEVYATLLDEGRYLCSTRTMYRILSAAGEARLRRNQLRHPKHKKPELVATGPNQVWSWDITKLLGPVKWTYFYLYVVLDIYSRYVVGWLLSNSENSELARRLIAESCSKQGVVPGQLTIHSDRGSSMKSKTVAQLYGDLGVTKSFNRPRVSNDNPYSESHYADFEIMRTSERCFRKPVGNTRR
jgi:putative transposase